MARTYAPCGWLVERTVSWYDEETGDGEGYDVVEECGAAAVYTDRGFTCDAGHSHVTAEVRWNEGWDYAEDDGEALRLSRAGTEPRDFVTGGTYRGSLEAVYGTATAAALDTLDPPF